MGKSAGMGKYYIRKDGTTVADDHRDRRYKLIHKESVASPGEKDAGQKHTFKGAEVSKYKISFSDGTPSIIRDANSPEELRAQYKDKKIKSVKKVK